MMSKPNILRPVGSSLRLRCKAGGNPAPSIRWLKEGRQIAYFGEENSHRKHSNLKLKNLQEKDSGDYKCVAENIHGQVNFTYSVEVVGKQTTVLNYST